MTARRVLSVAALCWAVSGSALAQTPAGVTYAITCRNACGQAALPATCIEHLGVIPYAQDSLQLEIEGSTVTVDHADGPETLVIPNTPLVLFGIDLFVPIPLRVKPGETAQLPVAIATHPGDAGALALHFAVHGEELYPLRPTETFSLSRTEFVPVGNCAVPTTTIPSPSPTTTVPSPPPPSPGCHGHGWKRCP